MYSFSKNVIAQKWCTLVHSTVLFTTNFSDLGGAMQQIVWYPYRLFGEDITWTRNGLRDIKHLLETITKHEKSIKHMSNTVDLAIAENANIAEETGSGYRLSIMEHNERVRKNINALSKVIDGLKLCGKF